MPPAARLTDMHTCPMVTPGTPPVPHVGGPILPPCAPTVLIGMLAAARMGDKAVCVGPPDTIALGSPTVVVEGALSARQGDPTLHLGVISVGLPTVMIGVVGTGSITINGMAVVLQADGTVKVGNAITITGTPEFQAQVIARMMLMANTAAGRSVLSTIDSSGKTMNIIATGVANSFAGPNATWADIRGQSPAGTPIFDGNGNPVMGPDGVTQLIGDGTGANVTMQLNPTLTLPNSLDPANPMPNDGIAFHEMNHGAHQMGGTANMAPMPGTGWTTQEEQTTISTGAPSEADYNRQSGYPYQRTGHGTTFVPNP